MRSAGEAPSPIISVRGWHAIAGTARELLEGFLAGSSRETQIADCLNAHAATGELLKSFGFSYSRPLIRMFRGLNDYPGRPELLCAILGPEFG